MSTQSSMANRLAGERSSPPRAWSATPSAAIPAARSRHRMRLWLPVSRRTMVRAAMLAGVVWAVTTGGETAADWWQAFLTGALAS